MNRVLCVWFPQWPLQRLLLERPELRNRPVVIATKGKRGREVRLASKPARDQGVSPGLPLAEAEALLEPAAGTRPLWGSPCLIEEDCQADLQSLQQRALWCQRYSPITGLDDTPAPESLLLSLDGCAHLLGGELPLAQQLARDFEQGGHHVRLAVANTVGAAWGLARYVARSERGPCIAPPIDRQNPEWERWLDPLPVEALRLTPSLLELLHELGVTCVGALRKLPRSSLPSRLGNGILRRLDQLWGMLPEFIIPFTVPEPILCDWAFEEPVSERATIEQVLERLISQLTDELARQQTGAQRLACRLFCLGNEPVVLSVGAVRPRAAARHWHDLLRLQLERNPLPGEVLRIEVEAVTTARLEVAQNTLFGNPQEEHAEREFGLLIERLGNRLGDNAVLAPRVLAEHQPEWAGQYEPATPAAVSGSAIGVRSFASRTASASIAACASQGTPRASAAERSGFVQPTLIPKSKDSPTDQSQDASGRKSLEKSSFERNPFGGNHFGGAFDDQSTTPPLPAAARPLSILPRPQSVPVVASANAGAPISFSWEGTEQRVNRSWGPEQIDAGWWHGAHSQRDYYRVETAAGQRFWLYRERECGEWFLHGIFE